MFEKQSKPYSDLYGHLMILSMAFGPTGQNSVLRTLTSATLWRVLVSWVKSLYELHRHMAEHTAPGF